MKILHTADWHLGKTIEGQSRMDEQTCFLEAFIQIVDQENPELIIIAGDIYDHYNPPARAEQLFYETLKAISHCGKRLTLVISGNHDHPRRLEAPGPLAREHGILMAGLPKTIIPTGRYGKHQVLDSGKGFVEIEINGERAVLLLLPYPSEKRLNEVLYDVSQEETENCQSYSDRIFSYFERLSDKFKKDTINLVVAHIFAMGSEEAGSERAIQLGGTYLIESRCFPKEAHYIALGHVHKPQKIPGTQGRARYSGSPIHFNRRETNFSKKCLIIEIQLENDCLIKNEVRELPLAVYKPIEVWKLSSIEEAYERCEAKANESSWVYLEIKTDRYIRDDEIKKMKSLKKDILEIIPIMKEIEKDDLLPESLSNKSFSEIFEAFYLKEKQVKPSAEIMDFLLRLTIKEDENETETS